MDQDHKQTWVKVNAPVDDGIASLVMALNEFEGIITVDSCQGTENEPAYVFFTCLGDGDSLYSFVSKLAASLSAHLDSCSEWSLILEWAGAEQPLARLEIQPASVIRLAKEVREVACNHV
ncbi:MAG: hypothetical protein ABIJ61_14840 [bacterium]